MLALAYDIGDGLVFVPSFHRSCRAAVRRPHSNFNFPSSAHLNKTSNATAIWRTRRGFRAQNIPTKHEFDHESCSA